MLLFYTKMSHRGVEVHPYNTFNDMHHRMYVIGNLISNETNHHWAIYMEEHTTYHKLKSGESVQVDWRSYMVHVSRDESDVDETRRPSRDDLVTFRYQKPGSLRCHIPLCPLDRVSQFPAYAFTIHNLTRVLAEFVFLHHHAKGKMSKDLKSGWVPSAIHSKW